MKVCAVPSCPTLIDKAGKCPAHQREAEQARGSSTQRGYGYAHQQERAAWAPLVATGAVRCRRCRQYIERGDEWDLGHDDLDRTKPTAPEHRGRCNRATASHRQRAPAG